MSDSGFKFEISLSVLNHLGRNLYRNFITVLGEAISNSWDADAKNVWIDFDKNDSVFSIKDDGDGMTADDFQSKFLKVGYSKRQKDNTKTANRKRPFIGAKGIGKLALLSCAQTVSVFTKTKKTDYVGGVIDNSGLDEAIKHDVTPDKYPLEGLDLGLIKERSKGHETGTILVFEETRELLRNSEEHIRKLLAMSFKFSLLDEEFNIFVNGTKVTIDDLKDLMDKTEFLWLLNQYDDDYVQNLSNLKEKPFVKETAIELKGFIATVKKPSDLKIRATEERATVDLFVNGRMREKNILRHIPTQRVVESYMYGQIHFDVMDETEKDPFTSSREGVLEDDVNFQILLDYLRPALLKIFSEWDKLRLKHGKDGDDEEKRKSKKHRRASSLYSAAREEFEPDDDSPEKKRADKWLKELQPDAEFNLSSYVDCFLAENLIRKYIAEEGIQVDKGIYNKVDELRKSEKKAKDKATISFEISKNNDDLNYLDMGDLAFTAEGSKKDDGKPSLNKHSVSYRPVRNAVCHTSLLSDVAKNHLNVTFHNIKAQVANLVSGKKT